MRISKHFSREEFRCKGKNCHPSGEGNCGFDTVDVNLLRKLEKIRIHFKTPVTITSGCRCNLYNESINGAQRSQHKLGRAADIVVHGVEPDDVADFADSEFDDGGIGRYNNFTHIDSRIDKAGWSGNY